MKRNEQKQILIHIQVLQMLELAQFRDETAG